MLRFLVPKERLTNMRNKNTPYFQNADKITRYFEKPVIILIVIGHLIYFFIFANLFINDKGNAMKFAKYTNELAQLIIALYLIIRFNPFRQYEINEYDGNFSFYGGIILLMSVGVVRYIEDYIANIPIVHNAYNTTLNKIDDITTKIRPTKSTTDATPTTPELVPSTTSVSNDSTPASTTDTNTSPKPPPANVKRPMSPTSPKLTNSSRPKSIKVEYSNDVTLLQESGKNALEYSTFDAKHKNDEINVARKLPEEKI
jgi:hypothetical protein